MANGSESATRTLPVPVALSDVEPSERALRRRRRRRYVPIGIGLLMVVAMIVVAFAAPVIAPFSPSEQSAVYVLKGPGVGGYVLGTDEYGRDLLTRVIWGTRVSLQVGLASVVIGFLVGVPLGIMAGYLRGATETAVMRVADMLLAFPTLLLALIIVAGMGGSLRNEILAIGVALTPNFVRLARSLALSIREYDYVMAARALGSGPLRVMWHHVFPNALYALVVVATLYIATAIRTEAGLSFLGLGVPPPEPSWGNILSEGRQYIKCCPWLTTFSGLAIMVAVLAFNLMGDALRDLLDPRLRGE